MCFDPNSSLLAWVISYSIAYYLFYRNRRYDRWNAAFILVFSLIQLLEAGLWTTVYDDNQAMNDLLTRIVLIILLLQPFVQSYMGATYTKSQILYVLTFIYFLLLIWGFYRITVSKSGQFQTSVGPNGHLVWNDGSGGMFNGWSGILYLAGLFVPLFFMDKAAWIPLVSVAALTAVWSWYSTKGLEFSSMWCVSAVAYSIVALFV